MISKNHKKTWSNLNYVEHFLILVSSLTGCVSISPFASLVGIAIGIMSSVVRLKICTITAGIKKYKPIIKEKRKKHDKIMLLGKAKLDSIEVVISKVLIDWYISYDEFVSVNVLKEYNEIEEDKKSWNFCGMYHINVVGISTETYERNGAETIVDSEGILWSNEKNIDRLDYQNLQLTTVKYLSDHRKHR